MVWKPFCFWLVSVTVGGGALAPASARASAPAEEGLQKSDVPQGTEVSQLPSGASPTLSVVFPDLEKSDDFVAIVEAFEKHFDIPRGLLLAIATVESMRRALAVHNFQGSRYFSSLADAVDYVNEHERKYGRSISIGYMQINWHVHKDKFNSLQEAFSPYHNVRAAVEILLKLYRRHGSWEKAIGWYNPKGGKWNRVYFQKVRRSWSFSVGSLMKPS